MKKFRKFTAMVTAIALAGCMMTSMSMLNVSAEGTTYSITINNAVSGQNYYAYQIFDGDYSDGVLSNINWGTGLDNARLTNLVDDLQALTLSNNSTPFVSCTSASDVAEVLGAITQEDAEITRKFADVVAKYLSDEVSNKTQLNYDITKKIYTANITDPGYYLVQDDDYITVGTGDNKGYTRYILEVVGDAEANHKNSVPTVMKKVKENAKTVNGTTDTRMSSVILSDGYNDVADYNIGDTVPFRLYGSMPSTLDDYDTYYYEFQDTLGKEFTVVDGEEDADINVDVVVKVYASSADTNPITLTSDQYTLTQTIDSESQATKINVTIDDVKVLKYNGNDLVTKDSIITVDYSATLNSNAVIGLDGQENKVKLVYSNNPNSNGTGYKGETPEDKVIVFTYELDITKVDGALYKAWQEALEQNPSAPADTKTYLKDAEFMLYTDEDCTKEVTIYSYTEDSTTKYMVWKGTDTPGTGYTVVNKDNNPLKTDANGKIKIKGLDDGTYYLKETKAPTGYNQLEGAVKLEIKANTQNNQSWTETPSDALLDWDETHTNGALKLTNNQGTSEDSDDVVTYSLTTNKGSVETIIANNKGSSLPSTGGIGTTIFYTVGGVLVVGAGVTLIAKKRAKNEQ